MVMFSNGEFTFMYRVGGIAVHKGRLLVEHNITHGFCFVPGGRVEYGENAVQALSRELDEELGGGVQIGPLVIVADNLFELDGIRYQEAGLYFVLEFDPGHPILRREGRFERKSQISSPSGCRLTNSKRQNSFRFFSVSLCGIFPRLRNMSYNHISIPAGRNRLQT